MSLSLSGDGVVTGLDSAASSDLGTKLDTAGGLVKIVDQSFSAVSSVSVNGCFTSAYQNYVVIFNSTISTSAVLSYRHRASGNDVSATNYKNITNFVTANTATTLSQEQATNSGTSITITPSATTIHGAIHVYRPQEVAVTQHNFNGGCWVSNQALQFFGGGIYDATTQVDGFSFIPASGTITGTLRVYGYRN